MAYRRTLAEKNMAAIELEAEVFPIQDASAVKIIKSYVVILILEFFLSK